MKKTLLLLFTLFSFFAATAQGTSYNLGFNQILNLNFENLSAGGYSWYTSGSITVPSNQTYKITHGSCYGVGNSSTYVGGSIRVGRHVISDSSPTTVWLSSGTYTVSLYFGSSIDYLYGSLSVVVFNIE